MRLVRLGLVSVLAGLVLSLGVSVLLVTAARAESSAHPLGNFTVNHYNGLRLTPAAVRNHAVVDLAELPTLQVKAQADASYAGRRCAALAAAQRLTVSGTPVPWRVTSSSYVFVPGQGGLRTSRLTCELVGEVRVSGRVEFADGFEQDRIGWREITAVGDGVRVSGSSVPAVSVSRELRAYPEDLLADPLDQRTATLNAAGSGGAGGGVPSASSMGGSPGGPFGDWLAGLDRAFTGLIGRDSLTVPLGLLAVVLAMVLGAGHALIPGHGKTIMAAYLAGRRGRPRDALVVGATVTATHTVGVLVVGLLLTAVTTLAGESVLAWLGLASGLLITTIGLRLLTTRSHLHDHGHSEDRTYDADGHGTNGEHEHKDGHHPHPDHAHGHGHGGRLRARIGRGGGSGRRGGRESHQHVGSRVGGRYRRVGLVGLGVAGGLVPSPSALIVLLGAIGLGRTWFGVALVTAYGVGMAATLTVAGLLLVKLVDRLERRASTGRRWAARLSGLAPVGTAAMVVLLGAGLALRSVTAL